MDYKILIELLFTFSPLIFVILIGFFANPELAQEEIESIERDIEEKIESIARDADNQRRQTIKRLDDERFKHL